MSKCVICKSSTKGNEEFCKVVTLMREAFEKWNIATVDSILKEAVLGEESEE